MNRPRLQIVRGLPGSGKSTYANEKWPHLLKLEFDYFCMRGGEYAWGMKRNAEGQQWLTNAVIASLAQGFDFVVCGVFAGHSEHLLTVVRLAKAFGYDVYVKTLIADFGNAHGVRKDDYDAMEAHFLSDADLAAKSEGVVFGEMPTDYDVRPMPDGK